MKPFLLVPGCRLVTAVTQGSGYVQCFLALMVSCGGSSQQGSTVGLSGCQEGRFSENFGWNQALLWPRACSWFRTFHMSFCGRKKDKGKGSPKWESTCVWRWGAAGEA